MRGRNPAKTLFFISIIKAKYDKGNIKNAEIGMEKKREKEESIAFTHTHSTRSKRMLLKGRTTYADIQVKVLFIKYCRKRD